ncbi:hypothetical protein KSP39_PZI007811 [Platanthera zijinensis]|uniref:DNA topoisomerase (ATP-hydrolyzing) n=1 Tax=Platanthera zijinensis TaxID=2320716 RepID=A0AAP0G8H9_9ASPA
MGLQEKEMNLSGEHVREGLTCIISVKVPNPEFEGQTKTRLGNPEVRKVVEQCLQEFLTKYLELHPDAMDSILSKSLYALKRSSSWKVIQPVVVQNKAGTGDFRFIEFQIWNLLEFFPVPKMRLMLHVFILFLEVVLFMELIKEKEMNLSGEHVREGLTCIISVKVPNPEFEGQTKTRLGNPEVRKVVEQCLQEFLTKYLELHPDAMDSILSKSLYALKIYRVSDMELVRVLPSAEDEVNVACFHPLPGGCLVYGTN